MQISTLLERHLLPKARVSQGSGKRIRTFKSELFTVTAQMTGNNFYLSPACHLVVVLTTYLITNSYSLHALFIPKEFKNNY